jgi:hypothetical protein
MSERHNGLICGTPVGQARENDQLREALRKAEGWLRAAGEDGWADDVAAALGDTPDE